MIIYILTALLVIAIIVALVKQALSLFRVLAAILVLFLVCLCIPALLNVVLEFPMTALLVLGLLLAFSSKLK
jgi:hypothetical protein